MSTIQANYPILLRVGGGVVCAQMIRAGRTIIIPLYAAEMLNLGIEEIGFIVSVAAFVDMLLFYPTGYIMDRWGRKFAIVPSFSLQTLGLALVSLTGGFLSLLFVACLIGLGNGLSSGTMMTLGADFAPKEDPEE